ncbi:MAG: hypothetical protein IJ150_03750 [Bacteroidales bacterium]|nr:hypothetical protein [Bacteroidales bacterium]
MEETLEKKTSELEDRRMEYLQLLETLIVRPKNAPGYYPAEAQTKLYALEGKIKLLSSLAGLPNDNWCKEERERKLKAAFVNTAPRRNTMYAIVGVGTIVLLVLLINFIRYVSSLTDIAKYETEVNTGDKYVSQSKHNNAIDSYSAAYINYDGYKSDDYKEQAFSKIKTSLDAIMKKAEVDNSQLYIAVQTVNNLKTLRLEKDDMQYIQKQSEILTEKVNVRTKDGLETLINAVASNRGKLNEDGKKILKELLLLSPNNYWLNFLNTKENE